MNKDNLEAIVHPLVLLSVVDHYNRVARDTRKRVVGVLLGTYSSKNGTYDITNSFAIPFEEELKDSSIWYLDHNYLEHMFSMFKKVASKEVIVGFYSTGPKIKENDIMIDELFRRYCKQPVFVIIDVRPDIAGLPTKSYVSYEEVDESDEKQVQRSFHHITSSIDALEPEEVGVEHLLRDINDPLTTTLANKIKQKMTGLQGLVNHLQEIRSYLRLILDEEIPINNQIIYNLQTIFNLLPNLNISELVRSLLIKTNDMSLVIYISSLIRCIISLHDLVNNKIQFRDNDKQKNENDNNKKLENKNDEKDNNKKEKEKK